jgi:myo-inositol-1(or 4)-monophosphatase
MIPNLEYLELLARQAGEILREGYPSRPGYSRQSSIWFKGEIDPVTEVDHRSEAFLVQSILKDFPDHRIVAEESGIKDGENCCVWYIDPLDGTVNFSHGVPFFSVSIAFSVQGQMRYGVVYDPSRDELFSAEKERGAWLNGERIQVSSTNELIRSLLVTGFPYDIRTNSRNNLAQFAALTMETQAVRRLGSAALDLCYVAAGRLDGYWELSLEAWDLAAGALIAEEAGALVTNLSGGPDYLQPPYAVVSANRELHPKILALLK